MIRLALACGLLVGAACKEEPPAPKNVDKEDVKKDVEKVKEEVKEAAKGVAAEAEKAGERLAAEAAKAADEARAAVAKLEVELAELGKRLQDARRSDDPDQLAQVQKQIAEHEQRLAEAKAKAARAERMKGTTISKECQDNPLAKGCM